MSEISIKKGIGLQRSVTVENSKTNSKTLRRKRDVINTVFDSTLCSTKKIAHNNNASFIMLARYSKIYT